MSDIEDTASNKRKQPEVDSEGNQKIDSVLNSDSKKEDSASNSTVESTSNGSDPQPPSKAQKVEKDDQHVKSLEQSKPENGEKKEKEVLQIEKTDVEKTQDSEQDNNRYTLLERGHIFFFYRPKVQPASEDSSSKLAGSLNEVQSFHILLLPEASASPNVSDETKESSSEPASSTGEKAKVNGVGYRLIKMGKKRLPEAEIPLKQGQTPGGIGGDSSEALWAEISDVGSDPSELQGKLGEQRYSTRTVGERLVGASRAAGRGHYVLSLQHAPASAPSQKMVHLAYFLSHPSSDSFGPVQEAFGLHESSSLDLQVRNPTVPGSSSGGPPGLDEGQKAELTKKELDENFGGSAQKEGTNYGRPENVDLLDKTGIELLVIKARKQEIDGDQGVGDEQMKALENLAESDAASMSTSDVLRELSLSSKKNPPEALNGEWI